MKTMRVIIGERIDEKKERRHWKQTKNRKYQQRSSIMKKGIREKYIVK